MESGIPTKWKWITGGWFAYLVYVYWGPGSQQSKSQSFTNKVDLPENPTLKSGVEGQMQVMEFALNTDKPIYRMTPKEIKERSKWYGG